MNHSSIRMSNMKHEYIIDHAMLPEIFRTSCRILGKHVIWPIPYQGVELGRYRNPRIHEWVELQDSWYYSPGRGMPCTAVSYIPNRRVTTSSDISTRTTTSGPMISVPVIQHPIPAPSLRSRSDRPVHLITLSTQMSYQLADSLSFLLQRRY